MCGGSIALLLIITPLSVWTQRSHGFANKKRERVVIRLVYRLMNRNESEGKESNVHDLEEGRCGEGVEKQSKRDRDNNCEPNRRHLPSLPLRRLLPGNKPQKALFLYLFPSLEPIFAMPALHAPHCVNASDATRITNRPSS